MENRILKMVLCFIHSFFNASKIEFCICVFIMFVSFIDFNFSFSVSSLFEAEYLSIYVLFDYFQGGKNDVYLHLEIS